MESIFSLKKIISSFPTSCSKIINNGDRISFVGRLLPFIRMYVSLPAGRGKTNLAKFVFYTFAASIIWNTMLTYAGIQLGNNWEDIDKYSIYLDIAAMFAIVVIIVWIISKRRSLRKSD